MKTQLIGKSSLVSTRLAYGCWRICGSWDPKEVTPQSMAEGRKAVIAAYEAGYTLFDNADIYTHGLSEKTFGDALKEVPGIRQKILIATKSGIRFAGEPNSDSPQRYDFSAEHILRSCEQSLKRMGIETIDLYQLHRPDVLMDPEEVAGIPDAAQAGKRSASWRQQLLSVPSLDPRQVLSDAADCQSGRIHLGRARLLQ